jgi:hypothetical protein
MRIIDGREMWERRDIAMQLQVATSTVTDRWWWHYTQATGAASPGPVPNDKLPHDALPNPDAWAGKVPLWYPETIWDWAGRTGRNPNSTTSVTAILAQNSTGKEDWRSHPRIVSGELVTYVQIAERFGVNVGTPRAWASKKAKLGGSNFPTGIILLPWEVLAFPAAEVDAWARGKQRLTDDGQVLHPRGRPWTTNIERWHQQNTPLEQVRRVIKMEFGGRRLRTMTRKDGKIIIVWSDGPLYSEVLMALPAGLRAQVELVRH